MANALQKSENQTFTKPATGQFAIGIVALNNPRALNALTMFEGSSGSYSNGAVERPVGQPCGKIPGAGLVLKADPWQLIADN